MAKAIAPIMMAIRVRHPLWQVLFGSFDPLARLLRRLAAFRSFRHADDPSTGVTVPDASGCVEGETL